MHRIVFIRRPTKPSAIHCTVEFVLRRTFLSRFNGKKTYFVAHLQISKFKIASPGKFESVNIFFSWNQSKFQFGWYCFPSFLIQNTYTVKLGRKERFDKDKLVLSNHFPWPICHLLHKDKELLALRNNFRVTKKFLIAKFDCIWNFKCMLGGLCFSATQSTNQGEN